MSEELKRFIEDAVYKWIKKQLEEGSYITNLRIEIDNPIEVKGMKGRIVGEIILGNGNPIGQQVPDESHIHEKAGATLPKEAAGEEMSLQEVEKLLKSLGV